MRITDVDKITKLNDDDTVFVNNGLDIKQIAKEDLLNDIEIGGTNLLSNTKTFENWVTTSTTSITFEQDDDDFTYAKFAQESTLTWRTITNTNQPFSFSYFKGKTITFSMEIRSNQYDLFNNYTGTTDRFAITFGRCTSSSTTRTKYNAIHFRTFKLSDKWQKVYVTGTITDSFFSSGTGETSDTDRFYIQVQKNNLYEMEVRKFKFEFGNKPTDWSPSPDDFIPNAIALNNAYMHNNIYRGKDLSNLYSIEQICSKVSDGSFDDLYVGDYFDITMNSTYNSSEKVRCVIAGFDLYYNTGDTALTKHHAIIVPASTFTTTSYMNDTNVTTGGYQGSYIYTTVLPEYSKALSNVFGTHLLTYKDLLTNATTTNPSTGYSGHTGTSSNFNWVDTTLILMNEVDVYGTRVFSSSGFDIGIAKIQLPLFRIRPDMIQCGRGYNNAISGRVSYWLSSVSSSTNFCSVHAYGYANNNGVSNQLGVRPRWLIG